MAEREGVMKWIKKTIRRIMERVVKRQDKGNAKSKSKIHTTIWISFFAILAIASSACGLICWIITWLIIKILQLKWADIIPPSLWLIIGIGCIPFFYVAYDAIKKGWSQVMQNYAWLLEIFGKNVKEWPAGLHIIFPYFGFASYANVYKGERQKKLFMDEQHKSDAGGGDVEFTDGSAPVEATVYFQVVNAAKATYDIANLESAIEEKMDSAVRSFLGLYSIDGANTIKARASLVNIMNNDYIDPVAVKTNQQDSGSNDESKKISEEALKKIPLWEYIHDIWGTKIKSIAISDIILEEKEKDARRKVLLAKKDEEASVHDRGALKNRGEGYASQAQDITDTGVDPNKTVDYLAKRLQWENVGEKGATVVVDNSGGSVAGLGAQFAAGQKAATETAPNNIKPKESV